MNSGNKWISMGCILAFLSVLLGAFAAHSLSKTMDAKFLTIFQTGVQYQMTHALGLILLGLWSGQNSAKSSLGVGSLFVVGIILFSGSLYALALSGISLLGAITPLGGLSFLFGWLLFAYKALRN